MRKFIISSAIILSSLISFSAASAYDGNTVDFYNDSKTSPVNYIADNLKCEERAQSGHQYFNCYIVKFILNPPNHEIGSASISFYRSSKKVCEFSISEWREGAGDGMYSIKVLKCKYAMTENGAFVIQK